MSNLPLRFIHASDFHLEVAASGMSEVPEPIADDLIDAPYRAAERVFDAVLSEEAELLVLSGDIVDFDEAGPRGLVFLIDQFQRLADHDIPVYWAGGATDVPEEKVLSALLPDNVHVFDRKKVVEVIHERDGQPRVRLLGIGRRANGIIRPEDFAAPSDGLLTIAVSHGEASAGGLESQAVDYWALGGSHERKTLATSPVAIHYPGTPQGRSPTEEGPHGCTLVQIDSARHIHLQPIVADAVRWQSRSISINDEVDRPKVEQRLRDDLQRLLLEVSEQPLLVSYTVCGSGPLMSELQRSDAVETLLASLRADYATRSPAAWIVSLAIDTDVSFPGAWYEEETMLGEFLRNVESLRSETVAQLDLDRFIDERRLDGDLIEALAVTDPDVRSHALHQATSIGVGLLRGRRTEEPETIASK